VPVSLALVFVGNNEQLGNKTTVRRKGEGGGKSCKSFIYLFIYMDMNMNMNMEMEMYILKLN
jgi:hypothetical protein